MDDKKKSFSKLLGMMERVMGRFIGMHTEKREFGTGVPLYRSEIHTVQAIGYNPEINVTELAKQMNVTKGAISQTVSKLVRKELVKKRSADDNLREVKLSLTEKGWTGFHNHERFHMMMFDVVQNHFGEQIEEKMETFHSVMSDLESILDKLEKDKI